MSGVDFAPEGGRPLHPDEGSSDCQSGWNGYTCTRAVGHDGRHQANGTTYLWAEWDSDE